MLAGNIPGKTQTLSLAIYNYVQLGKDSEAYILLGITVGTGIPVRLVLGVAAAHGKENASMRLAAAYRWRLSSSTSTSSFDARVTAIFGPSGSGKTTLLDAVAGLRDIATGEIEIGGKTLFSSARKINLSPQRRNIGYVPQEGALFPHLSVRQNILFGAERSVHAAGAKGIGMEHVLEILEIAHLLARPVTKLSGGEAQRVALARAILSRPQLLLLDEPLAALDIGLKEKILPYLARVRDEFAIPMIYVTHNVTEVLTLADWVLVIRGGRLLAQGAPKETLMSAPRGQGNPRRGVGKRLLGDFHRVGQSSRAITSAALHPARKYSFPTWRKSDRPTFQIRVSADDILVGIQRPEGISAGNILPGTVRAIDMIDDQALVSGRCR